MAFKTIISFSLVSLLLVCVFWPTRPTGDHRVAVEQRTAGGATDELYANQDCAAPAAAQGDASDEIEACIGRVTADGDGGTVKLSGRYVLNDPIDLDSDNELGVRLEGLGTKRGGVTFLVRGRYGVLADTNDLSSVKGPAFENVHFEGNAGDGATAMRFVNINDVHLEEISVQNFPNGVGVEFDSDRSANTTKGSDSAFHEIYDYRSSQVGTSILHSETGGFHLFGAEMHLDAGDVGIREVDGYQAQVDGLKLDGCAASSGCGTGIYTTATAGDYEFVAERMNVTVRLGQGSSNTKVRGYVSDWGTMRGVVIDDGASNALLDVQGTEVVNNGSNTRQVDYVAVP